MVGDHRGEGTGRDVPADRAAHVDQEPLESRFQFGIGSDAHPDQSLDAVRDLADPSGPAVPVLAVPALLHQLGGDRVLPGEGQFPLDEVIGERGAPLVLGASPLAAHLADVADHDYIQRDGGAQVGRVDPHVGPAVVGTQRLENAPHLLEAGTVEKRVIAEAGAFGHHNGDHDVAVLLAFGAPHHPPDGLHHVDLGPLGLDEEDRIEGGHVHTLGEHLGVGHDPALANVPTLLEPVDQLGPLVGVHLAVHVLDRAIEQVGGGMVGPRVAGGGADHRVPPVSDPLRCRDRVGEGDGPSSRVMRVRGACDPARGRPGGRVGEGVPAARQPDHIVDLQPRALRDLYLAVQLACQHLVDCDDHDLVVGQVPRFDGIGEVHPEELGAEHRLVVHRVDPVVLSHLGDLLLRPARVDAWGGGHEQAAAGGDPGLVVDHPEACGRPAAPVLDPGRAMGFVADHQVEVDSIPD